ncbi:MAG: hypothetical protein A2Y82_04650 [Candidatus Buchananbacteria bacterium RBG_13_36_9]|uniref:PaaD zinc beta ribbon domain-containing protein n=1 Tax=Candidatus Buchananbacteria bacterium RBG_13_36_9 TaxID=1797530 RepID=A0A1G1XR41_9BACT|nr:MAG: hypothetical protein A2Y82_04650 [Candidatus Buchananbacteria bacterium RBG_13_36_9]
MPECKLDYNALPEAEKNQWGNLECPQCESRDYEISKEDTQQGSRKIYTCKSCQTKFRDPRK